MDVTELSFTYTDKEITHDCMFIITGLTVMDADGNYEVDYDDIDLVVDGQPYNGEYNTWHGQKLSAGDLFDTVLNCYFMQNGDYGSFSDDWKVFDSIEQFKEYDNGLLMTLPMYQYGEVVVYDLDLATPEHRYYSHDEDVLLLTADNVVLTDMENFYMESFEEDIAAIESGSVECLYMSDNVSEYLAAEE